MNYDLCSPEDLVRWYKPTTHNEQRLFDALVSVLASKVDDEESEADDEEAELKYTNHNKARP